MASDSNSSIVAELARWVKANEETVREAGIEMIFRQPRANSPWKSGLGFIHNDIAVDYTVWERTIFQTSLIVLNGLSKTTLVSDDNEPSESSVVHGDLDDIVRKLIDGTFASMKPDPKFKGR